VHGELTPDGVARYVAHQLDALFYDGEPGDVTPFVPGSLDRLERALGETVPTYGYFWRDGRPYFNHRHGDVYCMFLYLLSNEVHRRGGPALLSEKLFLLNKALHGIDVFYSVELPDIFVFGHPLATVLGRGRYEDYLLVYQRVTVGSSHDVGDYPVIGRHVSLYAGATALGHCHIGDGCVLGAGALLIDQDLPDNTLYTGAGEAARLRPNARRDAIWR
jgi:serine O-acetyltransferase